MTTGSCYTFWGMVAGRSGPAIGKRSDISYRIVSTDREFSFDNSGVKPKRGLVDSGADIVAAEIGDPAIICVRGTSVFIVLPTEAIATSACVRNP